MIDAFEPVLSRLVSFSPALAGGLRAFLSEYLAPAVPFGGRERERSALARWAAGGGAPVALLCAPAGRGKSALLVRWLAEELRRGTHDVVFWPVSARFETNTELAALSALAAQLAALAGEPAPRGVGSRVAREIVRDHLARSRPAQRRLLLVLDGIDEGSGWEPGPGLWPPADFSDSVRVLLSARTSERAHDGGAWRLRVGLGAGVDCWFPSLPGLSEQDIVGLLVSQTHATEKSGLICRATAGDPLLVRLLLDAREHPSTALPRGPLDGLLARSLERLLAGPSREAFAPILGALGCAFGPLRSEDLSAWLGSAVAPELLASLGASAWVAGDERRGWVLSHPRLAAFVREQWLDEGQRQDLDRRAVAWGESALAGEGVIAAYLLRHLRGHLERSLADARLYAALVENDAWRRGFEALDGSLEGFVSEAEWVWARLSREDARGPRRWLPQQVLAALCVASAHAGSERLEPETFVLLVDEGIWSISAALAHARLRSDPCARAHALAALVPLTPAEQAQGVIAEALAAIGEPAADWNEEKRLVLKGTLAARLTDAPLRAQVWREVCEGCRWLGEASYQLPFVCSRLASLVPAEFLGPFCAPALREGRRPRSRGLALEALAPRLEGELLTAAIGLARSIAEHPEGAAALAALRRRAGEGEQALRDAISCGSVPALLALLPPVATAADDEAVGALLARGTELAWAGWEALGQALRPGRFEEAWRAAGAVEHAQVRAAALCMVLRAAPDQASERAGREAVRACRETGPWAAHNGLLKRLGEHLPAAVLPEALAYALEQTNPSARHYALRDLAMHAEGPPGEQALAALLDELPESWISLLPPLAALAGRSAGKARRLLAYARARRDAAGRAKILEPLARGWRGSERRQVLLDALAAASTLDDSDFRAQAVGALASRCEPALADELLARGAEDGGLVAAQAPVFSAFPSVLGERAAEAWSRRLAERVEARLPVGAAIAELASRAPRAVRARLLAIASEAHDPIDRARGLLALVEEPETEESRAASARWLAAVALIEPHEERGKALLEGSTVLPAEHLAEALALARALSPRREAALALVGWLPRAEGALGEALRSELLALPLAAEDAAERLGVLWVLLGAPALRGSLGAELYELALETASCASAAHQRPLDLCGIARNLPPELAERALRLAWELFDRKDSDWPQSADHHLDSLVPAARGELLDRVVSRLRALPEGRERFMAYQSVIPRLPLDRARELLTEDPELLRWGSEGVGRAALDLAEKLPASGHPALLGSLGDHGQLASAVMAHWASLDAEAQALFWRAVDASRDDCGFLAMARGLPVELLGELEARLRAWRDPERMLGAWLVMGSRLGPGALRARVTERALELLPTAELQESLWKLPLGDVSDEQVERAVTRRLQRDAARGRRALLSALTRLAPLLARLGDAAQVAGAVLDAGRRFP